MSNTEQYNVDSWINTAAGIGGPKDKSAQGYFSGFRQLADQELSALYYGNAIANKIVYKIPEMIHQAGYVVKAEHAPEAHREVERLEIGAKILECHWQARLFGAAAGVLLADDGRNAAQPLDATSLKSFSGINCVDRRYLRVAKRYSNPLLPGFGEPEILEILPQPFANGVQQSGAKVHVSRTLLFYGQKVDKRELPSARGFGYSVLQVVYDALRNSDTAMASLGSMLLEASVSVFKIQNLIAQLTSPNRDKFLERMAITNEQKSTLNSVLLDAEKEDYTRVASQFGGVAESIDRVFQYVAAAADYPMTVLFGISPGGMNATGESDTRQWYNRVASVRQDQVEPHLRRAHELVFAGLGYAGEEFEIVPGPIETPTPSQDIAYRKAVAEVDAIYITNDVLVPEQVQLARFGQGYSPTADPKVDVKALEASLQPTDILPEGARLELTPSDIASVVKVREARESVGKAPLTLPDGSYDPDNDLTVSAYKAKHEAPLAQETAPDGQ